MKTIATLLAAGSLLLAGALTVSAQVISYTGGVYNEDFNSMAPNRTTTLPGWFVGSAAGGNGAISKTTLRASDGGASTVTNYNVGVSGDSDRALGSQAGTAAGGDLNMEVRIQNDTGADLGTVAVFYDGEQWRANNVTELPQKLVLMVGTNGTDFSNVGPSFDFTGPVTTGNTGLNGNLAANRIANLGGTYTLPYLVAPGQVLYIRWYDTNNNGADNILAVDNFSFIATNGTFPPGIFLTGPTNGQAFTGGSNVIVYVRAVGAVTNVSFYLDGSLVGSDTNAPFAFTIPNIAVGSHTVDAVAMDNTGAQANAPTVNILATNFVPLTTITSPTNGQTFIAGASATFTATYNAAATNMTFYRDGTQVGSDNTSPYSITLSLLTAGTFSLVAVAADGGGILTTSAPVSITVNWDPTPFVLLSALGSTNPTSITLYFPKYLMTTNATNTANYTIAYPDGSNPLIISNAAVNNNTSVVLTTGPRLLTNYNVTLRNLRDLAGNPLIPDPTVTNLVTRVIVLPLDANQLWLYNDTGNNLSNSWQQINLADTNGWLTGVALFDAKLTNNLWAYRSNYAGQTVRTFLAMTNASGSGRIITYYYRTTFECPTDPTNLASLLITHYFDDGAVVYINGQDCYRFNVTNQPVRYTNFASANVADITAAQGPFVVTNLSSLVAGVNVLAVETHQENANSSDSTMGAILEARVARFSGVVTTTRPQLAGSLQGGNLVLTWDDPSFGLETASEIAGQWNAVPGAASGYSTPIAGARQFYRLVK